MILLGTAPSYRRRGRSAVSLLRVAEILQETPLSSGPVEIRGALEIVPTAAGLLPRRLPEWTRAQYQDPSMERQATSASGVRLVFRTTATVLELDVLTTVPVLATWDPADPPPETDAGDFELCVDGVPVALCPAPVGNRLVFAEQRGAAAFVPGLTGTVRFDGLRPGLKDVEIWLPQWVKCEPAVLRSDAAVEAPAMTGRRVWLHRAQE